MYKLDVAHVFGLVGKWIIIIAVFGLSITLSYMFFLAIAPPDKPWFPIAGLSLTEGGFLVWMFVFRMIKYHPVHKSIAGLMTLACAACSLTVAGFEFYSLLATHFDLLTNPLVAQYAAIFLLAIFAAHFIALIAELFVGENEKNPFIQRGNLIPMGYAQNGNLIPMQGGGTAAPLASKRGSPKVERNLDAQQTIVEEEQEQEQKPLKQLPPMKEEEHLTVGDVVGTVKEGASLLTQKAKDSIKSGRKRGSARGTQKETTDENMLHEGNHEKEGILEEEILEYDGN